MRASCAIRSTSPTSRPWHGKKTLAERTNTSLASSPRLGTITLKRKVRKRRKSGSSSSGVKRALTKMRRSYIWPAQAGRRVRSMDLAEASMLRSVHCKTTEVATLRRMRRHYPICTLYQRPETGAVRKLALEGRHRSSTLALNMAHIQISQMQWGQPHISQPCRCHILRVGRPQAQTSQQQPMLSMASHQCGRQWVPKIQVKSQASAQPSQQLHTILKMTNAWSIIAGFTSSNLIAACAHGRRYGWSCGLRRWLCIRMRKSTLQSLSYLFTLSLMRWRSILLAEARRAACKSLAKRGITGFPRWTRKAWRDG